MCNHGHHPLHGKFLSLQSNSVFPIALTSPTTGEMIGGIIMDILDLFSHTLGFTYNVTYDGRLLYTESDGTMGGAYGKVKWEKS